MAMDTATPPKVGARERLRSIAALAAFFGTLLLLAPLLLLLLAVTLGRATNLVIERVGPLLAAIAFRMAGIRFEVRHHADPTPGPAVFVFNHASVVDILSLLALGLPRVRFVMKWELQYNPLFLVLGRLTGQIFVRRDDPEQAVAALHRAYERIRRKGLSLLMAPEGTRAHDEVVGPFKKGPFRTAMDLDYPIVPVYFEGNRDLARGRSLWVRGGRSVAHFHPAVDTSDWRLEDLDRHVEEVRELYLSWVAAAARDP